MMPSVSVIIPVYNGAQYIEHCLESLQTQTLKNLEIIFIDDGSADNSLEKLKRIEDNSVCVFTKENGGAGSARNIGLAHATGEYISFLDVDDTYAACDTLETLYQKAKENDALICGGSFGGIDLNDYSNKRVFCTEGWVSYSDYQFDFGFQRFIYSRNLLSKYKILFPQYRVYEDPVFFAKAMTAAEKFYAIPDIVYGYSGSHQSDLNLQKTIDYLHGLRDNLRLSKQYGFAELHKELFNRLKTTGSYYAELQLTHADSQLLNALMEANTSIDTNLLREANVDIADEYLLPALETIWNASQKYMRLRKVPSKIRGFFHR